VTRKLPSVSLEESVDISTRVERAVLAFPEVSQVVTKIGRPDLATEAMGIYQGDVYVNLHPADEWKSGWSKEELIQHLAAALAEQRDVIEDVIEPYLMQLGLLMRTPRGRLLSEGGYRHLGLSMPRGQKQQLDLLSAGDPAEDA